MLQNSRILQYLRQKLGKFTQICGVIEAIFQKINECFYMITCRLFCVVVWRVNFILHIQCLTQPAESRKVFQFNNVRQTRIIKLKYHIKIAGYFRWNTAGSSGLYSIQLSLIHLLSPIFNCQLCICLAHI